MSGAGGAGNGRRVALFGSARARAGTAVHQEAERAASHVR